MTEATKRQRQSRRPKKPSNATSTPQDKAADRAHRGNQLPKVKTPDKDATRTPTKLDRLVDLLSLKEGATIEDMTAATGWQAHSVRGALAGALKRKGHVITSDKQGSIRRYRIGTAK